MTQFPIRPGVTTRMRLRGHDYSQPGFYFITVCMHQRLHRLGTISEQDFIPSEAGTMIADCFVSIPVRFPGASLDTWCLMPNHLHGLLAIGVDEPAEPPFPSIPRIMDWFKSVTTVEYIQGVKHLGWSRFDRHLWQPKYHDRIIRNDRELDRVRTYILNNPSNWQDDEHFTI